MTLRVLIIEDNPAFARLIQAYLDSSELSIQHSAASRVGEGLEALADGGVDLVLMDLGLPDSEGVQAVVRVHEAVPDVPIIVMSGCSDRTTDLRCLRAGAQAYLVKGEFQGETLSRTIRHALARTEHHGGSLSSPQNGSAPDCDNRVQRRQAELAALHTVAVAVSRSLNLEVVLTDALDALLALELFQSQRGAIFLVDPDGSEFQVAVQRGMPKTLPCMGRAVAIGRCGCGRAALEERTIVCQHEPGHPCIPQHAPDLPVHVDVSVPLIAHHRVVGVLNLWLDPDISIEAQDKTLLKAIGGQIALAVINSRLYQAEREQRLLAEQSRDHLLHNERLAATGRLAASLAHELSNPLQAIHNSLQMILSFPFSAEEMQEYIEMADEEVERLVEMVDRILDFSRRPGDKRELLEINRVVGKVLELANKYLQHRQIILRESLDPGLPKVKGNATTLGQVVLNLIINAVEAMPNGGTLAVSTERVGADRVSIRVSDDGVGISEDDMARIFEPFYSTKSDGTGLGLSISQSIVRRHNGEIKVQSVRDEGSTFTVILPVCS